MASGKCLRCSTAWEPVFHQNDCPFAGASATSEQKNGGDMTTTIEAPKQAQLPTANSGDLLSQLLLTTIMPSVTQAVEQSVRSTVDIPRILEQATQKAEEIAAKYAQEHTVQSVEIRAPGKQPENIGVQHAAFPIALRWAAQGRALALKGPAGTGKTWAAQSIAQALGRKLYGKSVAPTTQEFDLTGVRNVFNGEWIPGFLQEPFEIGGVGLVDELDNGSADALLGLNMALDSGFAYFGGRRVEKHPDCVFIATLNTIGQGRDSMYVGRSQLDAATLDRFNFIDWPYDKAIESSIIASYKQAAPKRAAVVSTWYDWLLKLREVTEAENMRVVVSTRALRDGAHMLASDPEVTLAEVQAIRFWNKMGSNDLKRAQELMAKGGRK